MIPKTIHCCWFGGEKTRLAEKCRASWARFAPDWEVREWNDISELSDIPGFAFFRQAIAAQKWAMASDWLRMAVLWLDGGVYLDYDVELVAGLDGLCAEGEWIASEWTADGGKWMNPGCGIALERGSAIAKGMLDAYAEVEFDPEREMMPWINERLRDEFEGGRGSRVRVLAPEVMGPIDMRGRIRRTKQTVGIHHYALSWASPWRKTLQWLSWHGFRWAIDIAVKIKRALNVKNTAVQPSTCHLQPVFPASFWEEHCQECGMPQCFKTCPMFERGWHGRCVRADGFEESIRGTGKLAFRRWGKIEMMYHGTMISERAAKVCERWNLRLRPLWRMLGMKHRAIRWRMLAAIGRQECPQVWRIRIKSERDERLAAAIGHEDGREIWRKAMTLTAGEERTFEWRLPKIGDRALFRIFPLNGEATGAIELLENRLRSKVEDVQEVEEVEDVPEVEVDAGIKCVAWDLDGVVWDGMLSEGDEVKVRDEVIETIKALDERGIVSSVCSKNDAEVALAKLKEFGIEEWFVFPQISWGAKSDGLKNLSRQMNIGLEAIVFVDDREENREEVRANAAGVRVEDENFARVRRLAKRPIVSGTMGSARRQAYRDEMRRGVAKAEFSGDLEAFNRDSGLEVELLAVTDENKSRCLELLNRTNQLNISGRRYDTESFDELLRRCETRCVRVRDKYGDYGIVGFAACRGDCLEELCFSCRVAKRGVERLALRQIFDGREYTANAVRTERNQDLIRQLCCCAS